MYIHILWIGKTKELFAQEGIQKYLKLISRFAEVEVTEIPDVKSMNDVNKLQLIEAEKIEERLKKGVEYFYLDEKGKSFSSEVFSGMVSSEMNQTGKIGFIIGGAWGFAPGVKKTNSLISLSPLTFTHEMVRMILLEQIYRAFTIIKKLPYHH